MVLFNKLPNIASQFIESINKTLSDHPEAASTLLSAYDITPSTPDDKAFLSIVRFASEISFYAPSLAFAACFFGNACVAADVTDVLIFQILDHILLGTPSVDDSRTDWPATIRALWQNSQQKQQESDKEQSDKATKQLGEEGAPFEPQKMPLEAYVGEFWNVAYGPMVVEVRDGKLFVDASDRSFPFTLTLEHVCRQTVFLAKMTSCLDKESGPCLVEFRFEGDRAVRLGLDLEPDEDKLIWFSRVVEEEEEEGAVGKKEEV